MDPKCYLGALQTPWYSNKILSDVKSDKNFIADPRGFSAKGGSAFYLVASDHTKKWWRTPNPCLPAGRSSHDPAPKFRLDIPSTADPRGFEPLISSVTGRRVKPGYTMGPLLFISIF
ncbi:MAG: hypothetical protein UU22_C0030G0006 [Parcubacteria group bacterium GW2011_GWA2_40_8]|nr:MAG: hypothetical protein UU22_C0030G0006 [Parcubacteria group bacterium GW2011_GWA2_40_8]